MNAPSSDYRAVLDFWFRETAPQQWFARSDAFDGIIRQRFFAVWQRAAQGELADWRGNMQGRLAEIIVLDQFSRNLFRNDARAFAQDGMALVLAQHAVALPDFIMRLDETERQFALMPLMHSESAAIHRQADELFRRFAPPASHEFELKHKKIIDRFGRYPHRNAVLRRESTTEETTFLREESSSF